MCVSCVCLFVLCVVCWGLVVRVFLIVLCCAVLVGVVCVCLWVMFLFFVFFCRQVTRHKNQKIPNHPLTYTTPFWSRVSPFLSLSRSSPLIFPMLLLVIPLLIPLSAAPFRSFPLNRVSLSYSLAEGASEQQRKPTCLRST